ncbi:class I SAM-dependent methyltransferase [Aliiroseovarius marinus]|uniref:class I SAM-dependent methyltransferase n=1 Tax=Aliiroseovarius marinus TaxID=2500159 RepID=UPI003D7E2693
MSFDYDALYKSTPQALGAPNDKIAAFFDPFEGQCLSILDVGCGQGRDAIALARRGHLVHGVDISPHGIADLLAAAEGEGLALSGEVADLCSYQPETCFDVLLIDRTLHMLQEAPRHEVLARLLNHVSEQGWAIIADEPSNMAGLLQVFQAAPSAWRQAQKGRSLIILQRV